MSVGRDKIIALWDLKSKNLISTIPVYEEIEALVTIPNPRYEIFISTREKINTCE